MRVGIWVLAMRADIQAFFDEATFTVTYLVADPAARVAAVDRKSVV